MIHQFANTMKRDVILTVEDRHLVNITIGATPNSLNELKVILWVSS